MKFRVGDVVDLKISNSTEFLKVYGGKLSLRGNVITSTSPCGEFIRFHKEPFGFWAEQFRLSKPRSLEDWL